MVAAAAAGTTLAPAPAAARIDPIPSMETAPPPGHDQVAAGPSADEFFVDDPVPDDHFADDPFAIDPLTDDAFTDDAFVNDLTAEEMTPTPVPALIPVETVVLPPMRLFGPDGLPQVLSTGDAKLYREIFARQKRGKWAAADQRIRQLTDRRLMGHVLAQRYLHPTAYRSKYKELRDWMAKYADHPEAKRIYALALKRRPKNYRRPNRPRLRSRGSIVRAAAEATPYRSTKRLSRANRRAAARIKRRVARNVLRTRLTVSEKLLAAPRSKRLLDQVEIDEGSARIAAAWFYFGNDDRAFKLADAAANRSGRYIPLAHWTAGLAAWRLDRLEDAVGHFEQLARAERASAWNTSAGAYWAARTHLKLRNPAEMSRWLALAAKHPRTFYGLLAQRALGLRPRFEFHNHELKPGMIARLEADPVGRRAFGLLQIGERLLAERELRQLVGRTDAELARALLGVAERARMAGLAFRLGTRLSGAEHFASDDGALDAALYPIPPWRPKNGFVVDRALIYAMIRQESGFNPKAKSRAGARGLMQIMPSTASFITRDRRFRRSKRRQLFVPETNLDLGQRYIAYLLDHDLVRSNLFRLVTAYNGGPGNLNKWQRRMDYDDDPLLFIESLPARETRIYIERVLTNLWIYRLRLGQDVPSLDGIAAGDWPLYVPLDLGTPELASNERF